MDNPGNENNRKTFEKSDICIPRFTCGIKPLVEHEFNLCFQSRTAFALDLALQRKETWLYTDGRKYRIQKGASFPYYLPKIDSSILIHFLVMKIMKIGKVFNKQILFSYLNLILLPHLSLERHAQHNIKNLDYESLYPCAKLDKCLEIFTKQFL